MQMSDPYAIRIEEPKDQVVAASFLDCVGTSLQTNVASYFLDECFVLADGNASPGHGDIAARQAADTAIWAYKHIRQHRYYWLDKKLFMKRVFRSTNMAVWQKQREKGCEAGLMTTLSVLMIGPRHYWLGNAGNTSAWLFHEGAVEKITREADVFSGVPKKILGQKRLGLVPDYYTGVLHTGDLILLLNAAIADYVTAEDVRTIFFSSSNTKESLEQALASASRAAALHGTTGSMSAVLVRKV